MWFTLQEVKEVTQAVLVRKEHARFRGVAIDSRRCESEQLFVALRGKRVDGHAFVGEAVQRGAFGALVEETCGEIEATIFLVPSTYEALVALGRYAASRLNGVKIGITGTVGKTTCKHLFARLLGTRFSVAMTPQSFNTPIGVSVSFANFEDGVSFLVVEAGVSEKGDMDALVSIIQPEVVVFTAFGEGHLQGLGSVEGVVEEKLKLVCRNTERVYLNIDRGIPRVEDVLARFPWATVIPFGKKEEALLRLESFIPDVHRLCSSFSIAWGKYRFSFEVPVLAPEVLLTALPAVHFALEAGVPLEDVREVLASFQELPGRGRIVRFGDGIVVDDTYNANPLSVQKMVGLATQFVCGGYKTCLVLGDMLELGAWAEDAHRSVLHYVKHSPV
ncbi:MAG: UDP-N-acetylmuramoyl-tripeptide--D-alanyl-D-alanine ligase, partial [Candidatus Caldatribacterium sp.]|nr:UDP-N-acetylmuramoyl-tripeptide--D-alanyl-D-alanine ligase [Candidatus Caldatribacterium sp.]